MKFLWFSEGRSRSRLLTIALLAAGVCSLALVVWRAGRRGPDHVAGKPPAARSQAMPTIPGLARHIEGPVLGSVTKLASAADDSDWDSEVVNKLIDDRLGQLASTLRNGVPDPGQLAALVADDFQCTTMRPELNVVFSDGPITVLRPTSDNDSSVRSDEHQGLKGFHQALKGLFAPFENADQRIVAFKVAGIRLADEIESDILAETSGTDTRSAIQQSAQWVCRWKQNSGDEPLRLTSIETSQFEEIRLTTATAGLFADRTSDVLADNIVLRDQFLRGMGYWHSNLDIALGFDHGMQGVALGDVNGDGLDDLYVCQPAGLVNRLFIRDATGSLRDATAHSGTDWLDVSRAALLLDLDNDSDQDLVVTIANRLALHANDGSGRFQLVRTIATAADLYSLCAADYDADGDLDIFACGYTRYGQLAIGDSFANPLPYHDANNGGPNVLLRNEGQLVFADATSQVGMEQNNRRFSYAAAWEDYDNDGDVDLYVANDFGRNNLYQNQAGHFLDVAASEGVEDIGAGMSVTWGDYDQNGQMDLYVSNMFSAAGKRVTRQQRFRDQFDSTENSQLQRHARGNSLFSRTTDGRFRDCSREARVDMGRWAWGATFLDINNDGWEDLYVANGFFTSDDTVDL